MNQRQYQEISTGDYFTDSTAYVYQELGNPRVIHFYKQYRDPISLEMLKLYHHMHRYLSKQIFPDINIQGDYNGQKYSRISFSILDLDPESIYAASDRYTGKTQWITQPKYINKDSLTRPYVSREILHTIGDHIKQEVLTPLGIHSAANIDTRNLNIGGIQDDTLHVTITDIGTHIMELAIDNMDRANIHTPGRHPTKITTRKELNATLLGYVDYTPIL